MKWIATQPEMGGLRDLLRQAPRFAIDTEADSLHSYYDKVCLIQISIPGEDFVIDPLSKIDLAPLGELLADPALPKILHGADYDLRILRRDFGFSVAGLIDTMICAQLLGYESFGLSALLRRHYGVELDKSHQRADWAMRPLRPAMLEYATKDTHYLLALADRLREELTVLGRWDWAVEEFGRLESVRFREEEERPEGFRRIKGSNKLDRRGLAALSLLYDWRDALARRADRPPFKIIGNDAMLELARERPTDLAALKSLKPVAGFHVGKYGKELLRLAEKARAIPEGDLPEKNESKAWSRDKAIERRVEKLKKVRDEKARELKIESSVLAPKHVLTAIAEMHPSRPEELAAIPAMRNWQIRVMGEELVGVLSAGER